MPDFSINKTINISETERKFLIRTLNKKTQWDKEFIIFQWFYLETKYETKLKLIIDMHSFNQKWVRVSKERISAGKSDKTVEYLNTGGVDLKIFLNKPFIAKRRSIKGCIHLDHFLFSNSVCDYLLEDEGDGVMLGQVCTEYGIELDKEVTANDRYKNANMAIVFEEDHLEKVNFLLPVFA